MSIPSAEVTAFALWLREHCLGAENAKTAKQLAAIGCRSSDRQLRLLRSAALDYGLIICADNAGYYYPATRAEVDETIGRLRSQGLDMLRQSERLQKLADRVFETDAQRALPV